MDLRTSAAVCTRSRKPPQSGELDMHELRSGPTKVKGLRRRGHTDRQTHELKGSELYPLSERMRIYIYIYILLAWLAWPGKAGWRREEAGRRYMEEEEGGYSVIYYENQ